MKFIRHTVVYGDSLHMLAQNYLGDVDRWVDIAILNELDYPFIVDGVDSSTSAVKKPGDTILIPQDEVTQGDVLPRTDVEDIYGKAFGEDIALFQSQNVIDLAGVNEGEITASVYGDILTVKGIANLKQAIIIRFSTPLGSLLRHPEFGSTIGDLAGKPNTYDTVHKLKIEIERVIKCDTRVEDVIFEQYNSVGDTVYADLAIKPVGIETAFKMSLVFGEGGVLEWA